MHEYSIYHFKYKDKVLSVKSYSLQKAKKRAAKIYKVGAYPLILKERVPFIEFKKE